MALTCEDCLYTLRSHASKRGVRYSANSLSVLNSDLRLLCQTRASCKTRLWANAQPDGRPAEYRWRPLFNAAVWLTPTTRVLCNNAAKMGNPLKFAGMPQTRQQISGASGPKFTVS